MKWRPFSGISCTVLSLITWLMLVAAVLTSEASAIISIFSVAWPTLVEYFA